MVFASSILISTTEPFAAALMLCGKIKPGHKEPDVQPNKTRSRPKGHIHTFARAQIPSLSFIQAWQ